VPLFLMPDFGDIRHEALDHSWATESDSYWRSDQGWLYDIRAFQVLLVSFFHLSEWNEECWNVFRV
jgi:hypothetical protein